MSAVADRSASSGGREKHLPAGTAPQERSARLPRDGDKEKLTWRLRRSGLSHVQGTLQGRRIRGFEGARAPPEHGSAPSHYEKHPLKMKGKLDETPFQTDIQQSHGGLDVHIRLMSV